MDAPPASFPHGAENPDFDTRLQLSRGNRVLSVWQQSLRLEPRESHSCQPITLNAKEEHLGSFPLGKVTRVEVLPSALPGSLRNVFSRAVRGNRLFSPDMAVRSLEPRSSARSVSGPVLILLACSLELYSRDPWGPMGKAGGSRDLTRLSRDYEQFDYVFIIVFQRSIISIPTSCNLNRQCCQMTPSTPCTPRYCFSLLHPSFCDVFVREFSCTSNGTIRAI